MTRILTGLRCSAESLHIGNYLGAFKPLIELSKTGETYLMLADMHSFTTLHNRESFIKNKKNVLLNYFSLLPDNTDIIIFEQSKLERHMDIFWFLSSVTPYSLILRSHAFKDANQKNSEINMATFNYSILMACDIINFDADKVPVGKDQKQHIEFARDIAEYFNNTYNTDIFKLPDGIISEDVGIIPGLDGRKMSKSYNNFIGVFDDEKTLKKRIMSIVTDDKPLEAPKDPDNCNIFNLIKFFAPLDVKADIRAKYLAGNYGYGHAKIALYEIILEYFKSPREKYKKLENNMDYIYDKLSEGNKKANLQVNKKYDEVSNIIGLR